MVAIVECQDIVWFEESCLEDEDIGCLEACLLVEGVTGAGFYEGSASQGGW